MKLRDLNFTHAPWHSVEYAGYWELQSGRHYGDPSLLDYVKYENAEDNALLASRAPEMIEKLKMAEDALNNLFNLIDSGVLVRDISKDHLPEYTINALKLTLKLKDALTTRTEITDLLNS